MALSLLLIPYNIAVCFLLPIYIYIYIYIYITLRNSEKCFPLMASQTLLSMTTETIFTSNEFETFMRLIGIKHVLL